MLADLSINHVERHALLCGFSVERTRHDYGYDLTMATYNAAGEIEPGVVYLQVKATDQIPLLKAGKAIPWPVSRRDLKLWLEETYPVILVVYDGQGDKAYWLHVQAYFADRRTAGLFAAGETITIHVPVSSRVDRRSFQEIARHKNNVHRQLRGKGRHNV